MPLFQSYGLFILFNDRLTMINKLTIIKHYVQITIHER
jgi:hypothetical protein